jgi:hypothetical protein
MTSPDKVGYFNYGLGKLQFSLPPVGKFSHRNIFNLLLPGQSKIKKKFSKDTLFNKRIAILSQLLTK